MELEVDELFGLPAHPLLVHVPVVLLPLAVIGAVVIAFSPSSRRRIGWLVVGAAGISLVFVQLAIGSGEALEEGVEKTGSRELINEHSEIAEQLRPFAALFFLALLAFMLVARARDRRVAASEDAGNTRRAGRDPAVLTLAIVTALMGVLSFVWVARAGHSGADATWHDVQAGEEGGSP